MSAKLFCVLIQLSHAVFATNFVEPPALDRPATSNIVINHDTFILTTTKVVSKTLIEPSVSKVKYNSYKSPETTEAATYPSTAIPSRLREKRSPAVWYDAITGETHSSPGIVAPDYYYDNYDDSQTPPIKSVIVYAQDRPCGPCQVRDHRNGRCKWSRHGHGCNYRG